MKQIIIACLLLCFASPLSADSPFSGAIKTKKIDVKKRKGNEFHIAKYKEKEAKKFKFKKKLTVKTCMEDRYGIMVGLQTVYYGKKAISESQNVGYVTIGKTEYVVHSHTHMTVYSTDDKQYIMVK